MTFDCGFFITFDIKKNHYMAVFIVPWLKWLRFYINKYKENFFVILVDRDHSYKK